MKKLEELPHDILGYEIYSYLKDLDIAHLTLLNSNFGKAIPEGRNIYNLAILRRYLNKNIYPFDHQIKAMIFMNKQEHKAKGGLLNIKMGLGKTNIAIFHSIISKGSLPSLIVTKKSIMNDWKNSLSSIFNDKLKILYFHRDFSNIDGLTVKEIMKYNIIITTYNIIARSSSYNKYDERVIERENNRKIINIKKAPRLACLMTIPPHKPIKETSIK